MNHIAAISTIVFLNHSWPTFCSFLFECRYSVENAYLEEKEDTCNALGEIAENSGYV